MSQRPGREPREHRGRPTEKTAHCRPKMNSCRVTDPHREPPARPRGLRKRAGRLLRTALAAGFAVSAAAAGAQTTVTLYGGARGGGEFDDASGNGTTFKLK